MSNKFSYLLSGDHLVTSDEESDALSSGIPFAVPYITSFDRYGFVDIAFNHDILLRSDLNQIVDQGLLSISLINEEQELKVLGTPKQPQKLDLNEILTEETFAADDSEKSSS